MRIHAERLRLQNRIPKILSQVILADRNGIELRSGQRSHLPRDWSLIVGDIVKRQRECANRIRMMARSKAKYRARVQPAAQINAHRHIRAQPYPYRLLQLVTKLRRIVGIASLQRSVVCPRIVEVPIPRDLEVLLCGNQIDFRLPFRSILKPLAGFGA